jgi:hypothetical protein
MMYPALVYALLAAEPTGRVEGQVLHAVTGEPVPKAVVTLQTNFPIQWGSARLADSSGRYVFENIPLGHYAIRATKSSFLTNFPASRTGRADQSSFEVNKNKAAHSIPLWLHPSAWLSGDVLDEDSEPMDGVNVNVWRHYYYQGRPKWLRAQGATTNAAGEFRIGGLAPGVYYLSAEAEQRGKSDSEVPIVIGDQEFNYVRTFFPDVDRIDGARAFRIKAGDNLSGLTLSMRRRPVFRVRGTFESASELADSSMVMLRRLPDPAGRAAGLEPVPRTFSIDRRTGSFQLFGLGTGEYEVIVSANFPGTWKIVGHSTFTIENNSLEGLVVPPVSLGDVNGKLTFEESSATASKVMPQSFFMGFRSATADEGPLVSGQAQMTKNQVTFRDLLPGKYSFSLSPISQKYFVKQILLNGSVQTSNVVEIPSAMNSELEFLLSDKVAHLRGSLESGPDSVRGNTTIVVEPASELLLNELNFQYFQCDGDGQFESRGMAPGEYYLHAFEDVDPSRSTDPAFLKRFRDRATKVTLGEEETKSVTLRAIPASEVLSGEQP